MKEEQSISDFNDRLCDIANEAFALREKFSEEKLVRKMLRSLRKRFAYKVTAIEEAKDARRMKLEELMGSLHTFEMNLEDEKRDKKSKGIALEVESHAQESNSVYDDDDDLAESIVRSSRDGTEAIEAVLEVEIWAASQPVFEHLEGIPLLMLKILMQDQEIDVVEELVQNPM